LPARPSRGTPHSFARGRGARGDRDDHAFLGLRYPAAKPTPSANRDVW
jgi:hypothetical protein